jgi:hypothetical protein
MVRSNFIRWKKRIGVLITLIMMGLSAYPVFASGGPPKFVAQPSDTNVSIGGIAILSATVQSATTMQLAWYVGNQPVTALNAITLNTLSATGTVSTLTIVGILGSNAGTYTLHATNSTGVRISNTATIVTLASVLTNTVCTLVSSQCGKVTNGFKLQLTAPTGTNVVILASSDFVTWTPIYTNTAGTGSVTYTDTLATNLVFRYYRAKLQ